MSGFVEIKEDKQELKVEVNFFIRKEEIERIKEIYQDSDNSKTDEEIKQIIKKGFDKLIDSLDYDGLEPEFFKQKGIFYDFS